jgi:hypothetical protein
MSLPRKVALLVVAAALVAAAGAAHTESLRLRDDPTSPDELAFLPRTSLLRAASLGHPELAADLVFIRTLTYFGTQFASAKNYDWLPRHIDTIVELDPYFHGAYRFAGLATMYNGRPITNHEVRESIRFLEAGLARFPSDWEMAFMLGCNYIFELKPDAAPSDQAAQKDRWRRVGADWIRRAAIAGGPAWLPGLAATIMTREGEAEAAIRYLEEAYLTAPDDKAREEVGRLLAARRASSMERLKQARDEFVSGWKQ